MLIRFINKLEDFIGIILMYMLIALLATQVFFRYVVNHPLGWTEEFARFVFIWTIFIGAVIATRGREHVRVELLRSFLPKKVWAWLTVFNELCIVIFLAFIIPSAIGYSFYAYSIRAVSFGLPMFFIYISLPFCGLLIILHTLINIIGDIRSIFQIVTSE